MPSNFIYILNICIPDERKLSEFLISNLPSCSYIVSRSPPAQFKAQVAAPMGSNKCGDVEYDGKEYGQFILELCKGNPRNIEMLFLQSNNSIYESPLWERLKGYRQVFLTECCVSQYKGFISERLSRARSIIERANTAMPKSRR